MATQSHAQEKLYQRIHDELIRKIEYQIESIIEDMLIEFQDAVIELATEEEQERENGA